MGIIKDRFKAKADTVGAEIKDILKEHGTKKIGEVQLSQIYQGMRGITGLVTETSLLDAQDGIRFRGYSIPELQEKLPKADHGTEPLPEGLFYLMLVGDLPTDDDDFIDFAATVGVGNTPSGLFQRHNFDPIGCLRGTAADRHIVLTISNFRVGSDTIGREAEESNLPLSNGNAVCRDLHPTPALEDVGVRVVIWDDGRTPTRTIIGRPRQVDGGRCRVVCRAVLCPHCVERPVSARVAGNVGRIAPPDIEG